MPFDSKAHDPVGLVVGLAARDSSAYLQAMKELASLLGNPQVRTQLDALGTEAELRRILQDGAARPGRIEAALAPAAAARNHVTRARTPCPRRARSIPCAETVWEPRCFSNKRWNRY